MPGPSNQDPNNPPAPPSADPTNPIDIFYSRYPEHYVYVNGRWQYRESKASGEAPYVGPTSVTQDNNKFDPLAAADAFASWLTTGDPFRSKHALNTLETGPGSNMDVAQSEDDASRLGPLITQLQDQAKTGSGAWESALKGATEKSRANAMALGQSSQSGMGYADKLNAIGNAQASADQRAVGQGNVLRAQQQQDASQQLAQILGQQGALEAQQAGSQSAVRQARREASEAQKLENRRIAVNVLGGAGQAATTLLKSDGGPVPGKAKVFGDDDVNDTVPAMLSPGEIVLPRSVVLSGDAPERAGDFVRAVQKNKNKTYHFDEGGDVPDPDYEAWVQKYGGGRGNQSIGDPEELERQSRADYEARKNAIIIPAAQPNGEPAVLGPTGAAEEAPTGLFVSGAENPSIENGGFLDLSRYNANRDMALQNANQLGEMSAGRGPSVVPQMTQNASDAAILAAMQQQAGGRGGSLGNSLLGGVVANADAAGRAGAMAGTEQHRGVEAFSQAMLQQRARDLGIAKAHQEAQWRNTMMNAGVSAANQAAIRGILGGAGAAAMGITDMLSKSGNSESSFDSDVGDADRQSIEDAFNDDGPIREGDGSGGPSSQSGAGDYNFDSDDTAYAAHGGEITESKRVRDFLNALRAS
jgi:hypothetical protein